MLKEYPIPEDQFYIYRPDKGVNNFIFCSLFIPIKNQRRRKRVVIFKTISIEVQESESWVDNKIMISRKWIKNFLQKTIDSGEIKYEKTRESFLIDSNRLSEIKFVTNSSISSKRIQQIIARY